jgi:hypothetical protein
VYSRTYWLHVIYHHQQLKRGASRAAWFAHHRRICEITRFLLHLEVENLKQERREDKLRYSVFE